MPDPSAFDRFAALERLAYPKGNGGIVVSSKYRGFSVEIRPPKWTDRKFWIGKLETRERARYVADAVFYYLGAPPFHFERGVMTLPAITCIGTVIGTPVELSDQEMFASHVRAIAKGEGFRPQRDDFILQVKNVVMNPDFPVLVGLDDDDNDREDELVFDEDAEKALQMSSHSGSSGVPVAVVQTHVAGPDSVGGSEAVQAYVPSFGFDSNDSGNILRSAGQSINAIVFSIDDCPTTSSEDEKIWIESIEELDKSSAAGTFTPSVASNHGEACRDGYETSPILNIPPIVWSCASTSSAFFGTPVELDVTARTALGSSPGWPSSQFAMNGKRQKIGD